MPPLLKTRDMPDARFWSAGLTARGECSATTPETSRQCKSIRSARMRAPDCSPSPGLGSSRQVPASQAVLYAGTQPKWYVDVGESDSMPARENNEWSQDEAAGLGLILGVSRRQKVAVRPDRHGSRRQEPNSDGQACRQYMCHMHARAALPFKFAPARCGVRRCTDSVPGLRLRRRNTLCEEARPDAENGVPCRLSGNRLHTRCRDCGRRRPSDRVPRNVGRPQGALKDVRRRLKRLGVDSSPRRFVAPPKARKSECGCRVK